MQPRSLVQLAVSGMLYAAAVAAEPAADSSYRTDLQYSHVEDATSRGVGQVSMITCIMSAMRPDALVNQGAYLALVDEAKCDPEGRSSSANSGASNLVPAVNYMTATVDATRASNSDPMTSNIWIDFEKGGTPATIFVRIAATAAPSVANPYGVFRIDYCGSVEGASGCMMNGYLEGSTAGMRYFEIEGEGDDAHAKALQLNSPSTTAGSGRMQLDEDSDRSTFDFAYDDTLFRRSDGSDDQCFSRDAADPDTGFSVWRYGLYDAATGERVIRNSGFPIEFVRAGEIHHGYLGYHGLSLSSEAGAVLDDGDTVQKVDYSSGNEPTKTDYTVVKAQGKLLKYSRQARTLHSMDQIKFTTFIGDNGASFFSGAASFTQYELYWDDAAGHFVVTGQMVCGQDGCQTAQLGQEQAVDASFWQAQGGAQGWSQSLGGEVFIDLAGVSGTVDSNAVSVVYRTQNLVYPADLPAALYCLRDCPTQASILSYFAPGASLQSPFAGATFNNWSPTNFSAVVTYSSDSAQALLLDEASQPVTFVDAEAYAGHQQYQYGVRSGRLFTSLEAAECSVGSATYCDAKVNGLEVYYQWETGANSFSQFAAVKDTSGAFLEFDAPLQLTYAVPNETTYGEYAGKSIVLQYGGFGDLWGIPGHCVSRSTNDVVGCESEGSRYVPAFVIPFDATVGRVMSQSTPYLVKWLDREIRFARKDPAVCAAAGLTLPAGMTLPTQADLKNPSDPASDIYIGVKPAVDAAIRVIQGDVKF